MAKLNKEIKIKHRFGNYELRMSDVKVEIEEVVNRTTKHVYGMTSYEYGLFSYLLAESIPTEDGIKKKTSDEINGDIRIVESLVYMMIYTNLIFSSIEFRQKYWELVREFVNKNVPSESPDDEKIIEEMKAEHEAKERLKENDA